MKFQNLNYDVLYHMTEFLTFETLYLLTLTCKDMNYLKKYIYKKAIKDMDKDVLKLSKYGYISGSFLLNNLIGNKFKPSDIDIYVKHSDMKKVKSYMSDIYNDNMNYKPIYDTQYDKLKIEARYKHYNVDIISSFQYNKNKNRWYHISPKHCIKKFDISICRNYLYKGELYINNINHIINREFKDGKCLNKRDMWNRDGRICKYISRGFKYIGKETDLLI